MRQQHSFMLSHKEISKPSRERSFVLPMVSFHLCSSKAAALADWEHKGWGGFSGLMEMKLYRNNLPSEWSRWPWWPKMALMNKKHPPNDESNATQCLKQATLMNNISKLNNTSTADSSDIIPSEYTLSVCRLGILILPPFPSLAPGWHLQWVVFV